MSGPIEWPRYETRLFGVPFVTDNLWVKDKLDWAVREQLDPMKSPGTDITCYILMAIAAARELQAAGIPVGKFTDLNGELRAWPTATLPDVGPTDPASWEAARHQAHAVRVRDRQRREDEK